MITDANNPYYQRISFGFVNTTRRRGRFHSGLCLFALLLVAAGCGTSAPAGTAPTATNEVAPAVTSGPTEEVTAGQGTTSGAGATPTEVMVNQPYGRADDYSWVAGQLAKQGSCWILTYVSPLAKSRPDQYSNHFALSPGNSWSQADVKDGEWVVVQGQPESGPGAAPTGGCPAHGYTVTALRLNPNASESTVTSSTSTVPAAATTTITSTSVGSEGTNVDIQVTQFTVSQNFEIRGQFTATNNGKEQVQELALTHITVNRSGGDAVFEAGAPSLQGGALDMKPMAGLPAGMGRPYSFLATPGMTLKQVAVGEEVTGTLTVSVDGKEQQVLLPVAKVSAVRIP